jgi:hypothetical protein
VDLEIEAGTLGAVELAPYHGQEGFAGWMIVAVARYALTAA